ncbi:MAG: hypothetical protein ABFR90_00520 [Planctomycetota bacterium]
MKNKNILAVLENHIDKIVLAVVVLVALFLLWAYVLSNPYGEKVKVGRREEKMGPSEIDRRVRTQAEEMVSGLDESPENPPPSIPPYLRDYEQLFQCPISKVSSTAKMSYPGAGDVVVEEKRRYVLPEVPALADVSVGHLRGAAQVPTEEVAPDRPYTDVPKEVDDLDFVSVSARFDVLTLNKNFQQSFVGRGLQKTAWKDPRLATPVFARLELQRRTKQKDGQWDSWTEVSRTAIDSYHKLLGELPLSLEQSPYGLDIWRQRYEKQEVQHDILQPEFYSFTVSRLEWAAPEFLNEAREILKKEEEKERRERQDELRNRSTRTTDDRRSTRTRDTRRRPARPEPDRRTRGGRGDVMDDGMRTATGRRAARTDERSVEDVQKDFKKEQIDERTDITKLDELLLVWAHDDTTKPGETYQYRTRIGVLNPIAGKDWLEKDQAEYQDHVVLWSAYSDPTAELYVPRRSYVFPLEAIENKDIADGIEGVKVEVAKYYVGQWRDYEFDVYPGQVIGYEVEDVDVEDAEGRRDDAQPMMMGMGMETEPDTVDFTTDSTFVDVVRDIDWGRRLRRSVLHTMLYYDAEGLQQIPVGEKNWSSDVRSTHTEIQQAIERGVQQRSPGMMDGVSPEMMDPMMMEEMMMEAF